MIDIDGVYWGDNTCPDDLQPTLHDIARGLTGCGDDDETMPCGCQAGSCYCDGPSSFDNDTFEWFDNASDSLTAVADAFTIEREHVHDAGCNGTLEHGEEILCGYPGSTGHIYCG